MSNLVPLRIYLQAEGAAVLALTVVFYAAHHFSWGLFALLFLVPDLSMIGYSINLRMGALFYNLGHTHVFPAALIAAGMLASSSWSLAIGLIWCAHIGFDRMVGYGLKCDSSFKETHLQKV